MQGVVKVRKRVTLMVVAVSAIFGICWGADSVLHLLKDFSLIKLAPSAIPIAHTAVMFNSAVNPFAYALINQNFRKKMRGILCCRLLSLGVTGTQGNDHEMANRSSFVKNFHTANKLETSEPSNITNQTGESVEGNAIVQGTYQKCVDILPLMSHFLSRKKMLNLDPNPSDENVFQNYSINTSRRLRRRKYRV